MQNIILKIIFIKKKNTTDKKTKKQKNKNYIMKSKSKYTNIYINRIYLFLCKCHLNNVIYFEFTYCITTIELSAILS